MRQSLDAFGKSLVLVQKACDSIVKKHSPHHPILNRPAQIGVQEIFFKKKPLPALETSQLPIMLAERLVRNTESIARHWDAGTIPDRVKRSTAAYTLSTMNAMLAAQKSKPSNGSVNGEDASKTIPTRVRISFPLPDIVRMFHDIWTTG